MVPGPLDWLGVALFLGNVVGWELGCYLKNLYEII